MLWKDMNQSSIPSYLVLPAGVCLHSHRIKVTPGSLRVIKVAFGLVGMLNKSNVCSYWRMNLRLTCSLLCKSS